MNYIVLDLEWNQPVSYASAAYRKVGSKLLFEVIQIGAAKSALHKTGQVVLEGHMQHCVLDGVKNGNEAEVLKRLTSAIEQFSRIV